MTFELFLRILSALGPVIGGLAAAIGVYAAIRSDLARLNANVEHLKEFDTLILERADDAHARIDKLMAMRNRNSTS